MFGHTTGELANLVTARSYTQLVFSCCVILSMIWPISRVRTLWAIGLMVQYGGVLAFLMALRAPMPLWMGLFALATSAGVAFYQAALDGFCRRPVNWMVLLVAPALCAAMTVAEWFGFTPSYLATQIAIAVQFVLLGWSAVGISRTLARIGGRILLGLGSVLSAAVTLLPPLLLSVQPESQLLALGVMGLGTAMGLIMQNMGWMALQKDAAEIQLERQAHLDGLTGVLNRRGFADAARQLLNKAQRRGRPVSLLLIDLDHFKTINDRWGHDMGDRVLAHVGKQLQLIGGPSDLRVRLGGEEFGVLLFDADPRHAHRVSEALREQLADSFQLPDGAAVRFSAGVALLGGGGLDHAMARADRALYEAKASGRDCAVISLDPAFAQAA